MKEGMILNFPVTVLSKIKEHNGHLDLRKALLWGIRIHLGIYFKKSGLPSTNKLHIPGIKADMLEAIMAAILYNRSWGKWNGDWRINGTSEVGDFIKNCMSAAEQYCAQRPPFCSLSLAVWEDYMNNDLTKPRFDKICLLGVLGIRSIIGPQKAKAISWDFLLSRMAGSPGKTAIASLPGYLQEYDKNQHRKRKERLLKALTQHWGIRYCFKGRRPWYCTNPDVNLTDFIDSRG